MYIRNIVSFCHLFLETLRKSDVLEHFFINPTLSTLPNLKISNSLYPSTDKRFRRFENLFYMFCRTYIFCPVGLHQTKQTAKHYENYLL